MDFEGSLADLKKAIEICKIENEDNEHWDNYSLKTRGMSQANFYSAYLPTETIKRLQESKFNQKDEILKKIKRRGI